MNQKQMENEEILSVFKFVASNPTVQDWKKQADHLIISIKEVEDFVKAHGSTNELELRLDTLYGYKLFLRTNLKELYDKVAFSKTDMQFAAKVLHTLRKR